jgi:hydroxypyruvate reductase
MNQEVMQVSPLPTYMLKAMQEQEIIVHDHAHLLDPGVLGRVTALVGIGSTTKVDRKLLSMLPRLQMISIFGTGYDGVDIDAVLDRGIMVTHTPDVLTDDVADLAMALVLSVGRRIPQADRFVRNGDWATEPFALTHRVSGRRMGIVGLGRIGSAIAKRAAAFDMSIAYTGRQAKDGVPYAYHDSVAGLAAEVDFLVVVVPGGEKTAKLIDAQVLQALGPKGYLINVARGSVVDEPALIQALKTKAIAGAGLDVFWDEPRISPELRQQPHVVLTPHIGSATEETRRLMADLALANLFAYFRKKPLLTPVPECQAMNALLRRS